MDQPWCLFSVFVQVQPMASRTRSVLGLNAKEKVFWFHSLFKLRTHFFGCSFSFLIWQTSTEYSKTVNVTEFRNTVLMHLFFVYPELQSTENNYYTEWNNMARNFTEIVNLSNKISAIFFTHLRPHSRQRRRRQAILQLAATEINNLM
jgi:hypothetical protein